MARVKGYVRALFGAAALWLVVDKAVLHGDPTALIGAAIAGLVVIYGGDMLASMLPD